MNATLDYLRGPAWPVVRLLLYLGGIMAFVGPKIFEQMGKAKSQEAKIRIQSLVGNIEMFRLEVGRYPANLGELLRAPGGAESKWNGPYAKEADLKDAWGNDYTYAVPGQGKPFDLVSMGADGRPGGEGENRDVSN